MISFSGSAMERLAKSSEDLEIWWDSNPLIFNSWSKKMVDKALAEDKYDISNQMKTLFDFKKPEDTLFSGATTNPRLSKKVIDIIPDEISPIADKIIIENPAESSYGLAWKFYKEITAKGAKLLLPLFEKSNFRKGYICAQVDPKLVTDVNSMLAQAMDLKASSPNIMIKCPGSKEGIYLAQILTSLGIPTNTTLNFYIPGVVQVAKAVKRGYEIGISQGVDYNRWRSDITIMMARFEDRQQFVDSASSVGIELTEELKRWAGVSIAKKAVKILDDSKNSYLSKLLLCSARPGPGQGNIYHIEKVAGGNLVYTMNPELIEDFMRICKNKELYPQIDEPVPEKILNTLLKIPYFKAGYEEKGIAIEDFINQPAFVYTREEFSGSMKEIEDYVINRKKKLGL